MEEFKEGDRVAFRAEPYRHGTVSLRAGGMLAVRWDGEEYAHYADGSMVHPSAVVRIEVAGE